MGSERLPWKALVICYAPPNAIAKIAVVLETFVQRRIHVWNTQINQAIGIVLTAYNECTSRALLEVYGVQDETSQ